MFPWKRKKTSEDLPIERKVMDHYDTHPEEKLSSLTSSLLSSFCQKELTGSCKGCAIYTHNGHPCCVKKTQDFLSSL